MKQLFDHLENRCIDKNTGTFISLEKAARDVKKGILKLDQLQRQPMQLVKLFNEYKIYGEQLKVSERGCVHLGNLHIMKYTIYRTCYITAVTTVS